MREIAVQIVHEIQNFYQINESFKIYGLKHKLHGKVKIFKKYAFQFSHIFGQKM